MAKENKLILWLPNGLSEMDVKGTLDGLAKALGVEGRINTDHFTPRGYDVILSEDSRPLLLLPSDDIIGSDASYTKDGKNDAVEAKIYIRCSASNWNGLVNGARR